MNVTFPVTLGPLAQLVLNFDAVKDQASVAGISVAGPLAPSFQLQSFLQNDTVQPAGSYGAPRNHAAAPALFTTCFSVLQRRPRLQRCIGSYICFSGPLQSRERAHGAGEAARPCRAGQGIDNGNISC